MLEKSVLPLERHRSLYKALKAQREWLRHNEEPSHGDRDNADVELTENDESIKSRIRVQSSVLSLSLFLGTFAYVVTVTPITV